LHFPEFTAQLFQEYPSKTSSRLQPCLQSSQSYAHLPLEFQHDQGFHCSIITQMGSSRASSIWNFVRLTRLLFLLGGFLLYALGAATAVYMGFALNWAAYLLGQVVVTSIQLMAQYLNEYYDMEVDRLAAANRTWFSGGSGIIAAGGVPPLTVLAAARLCAVAAILTGVLACLVSPWMIPIVLLSLLGSWFYSAPPLALMSSGWGELTTSLIVAWLVPLAGYCMQGGIPTGEISLFAIPLVLVHMAMLIAFEFPDHAADRSVGKKTLAVRLGLRNAAWMLDALITSAFVFLAVRIFFSNSPGKWMGLALPLAIWQMGMIHRVITAPTRSHYYLLTAAGLCLFVLMTLLALLGFVLVA
jgi:1,4-dihydroxy-2-naphthoate polyprenyltransferase